MTGVVTLGVLTGGTLTNVKCRERRQAIFLRRTGVICRRFIRRCDWLAARPQMATFMSRKGSKGAFFQGETGCREDVVTNPPVPLHGLQQAKIVERDEPPVENKSGLKRLALVRHVNKPEEQSPTRAPTIHPAVTSRWNRSSKISLRACKKSEPRASPIVALILCIVDRVDEGDS